MPELKTTARNNSRRGLVGSRPPNQSLGVPGWLRDLVVGRSRTIPPAAREDRARTTFVAPVAEATMIPGTAQPWSKFRLIVVRVPESKPRHERSRTRGRHRVRP